MVFNTGAALLDAIVLAVVSKEPEGTYGYKITQEAVSYTHLDVYKRQINADGYFVDAKSKSIVLSAEAEKNIITFCYYKIGSVEFQYVIKYVDDNNNVIYSSDNLTTKDNILTVAALSLIHI